MKIDHVSVGGSDLAALEKAFAEARMETVYGGPHSSGLTKMSLLGFRDGSYIELISVAAPGAKPGVWAKQIEQDGGPCAWAVEVEDTAKEVERARALGIRAEGPADYSRKRPDGVSVEWKLGFLGDEEPGALLPFLITDTTPRDYRVKPSPSVSGPDSILDGIEKVIIGVKDIHVASNVFRRLYGWDEPVERRDIWPGVTLASFEDRPVVLASPSASGWLQERLVRFGTCPCAFLISTRSVEGAARRYPLEEAQEWFGGRRTSWFEPLRRKGIMIGVVGR